MHSDGSVGLQIEETILSDAGLRPVLKNGNVATADIADDKKTRRSMQQTAESPDVLENEPQFDDTLLSGLGLVTPSRLDDICAAEEGNP